MAKKYCCLVLTGSVLSRLAFLSLQISVHEINTSQDDFVVLASDGLWDHVSNYEAVEIVRKAAYDEGKPEVASDRLVQVCQKLQQPSHDEALG